MIWFAAGMAGLLAGVAAVRLLVQPPSGLRLTVFRPWLRDPWPRGVQEDDAARFDWSAAKGRRAAIKRGWEDIVVTPTASAATSDADPVGGVVEDLPGGAIAVEHIDAVDVHRSRH